MWDSLYSFFSSTVFGRMTIIGQSLSFEVGGLSLTAQQYLSWLCSTISLIVILILCCLFVYKIIRLIGGLIR